jgi:hypothetical protein
METVLLPDLLMLWLLALEEYAVKAVLLMEVTQLLEALLL